MRPTLRCSVRFTINSSMKKCCKCEDELVLGANWPESHRRIRVYKCLPCANQYSREWIAKNKEKALKTRRDSARRVPTEVMLWRGAKSRATKAGLPFSIEIEDIVVPDICPALGIPLVRGTRKAGTSPSLDRIEPAKGYVKGNIAVISDKANRIKNDGTAQEILKVAKWLESALNGPR